MLLVPLSQLALVAPPRRAVLRDAAAAAALSLPWLPPHAALAASLNPEGVASETRALDQAPVVDPGRFRKLESGVRVADLKQGSGPEVGDGSRVALQWVLRRSNGYFVDSSLGALASGPGGGTLSLGGDASEDFTPFLFTVGDGKALRGIEDGVRGMRQGGVRRLVLPLKTETALAYTLPIDKSAGPLPAGFGPRRQLERELAKQDPYNYFMFEVEAVKVKGVPEPTKRRVGRPSKTPSGVCIQCVHLAERRAAGLPAKSGYRHTCGRIPYSRVRHYMYI